MRAILRAMSRLGARLLLSPLLLIVACVDPDAMHPAPAARYAAQSAPAASAAPASMMPPQSDEPVTMGPPTARCPQEEPLDVAAPPPITGAALAAPLTYKVTPAGITLDSEGASAGRVLSTIAAASKNGIEVHDVDASVPIYAHVHDQSFDSLVRSIAQAAGLEVVEAPGSWSGKLTVVDGHAQRQRVARVAEFESAPLETRVIAVQHPEPVAHVLALTLLSCRGLVTAAPQRSLIVVQDVGSQLDRIEQLVRTLDTTAARDIHFEVNGVPNALGAEAPLCMRAHAEPAPNLPPSTSSTPVPAADGNAAGDVLLRASIAEGKDIIVGCGGDAPAYYAPSASGAKVADVAPAVGLVTLGGIVYGSIDLSLARANEATHIVHGKRTLRAFTAQFPREVAAVASEMLGHRSGAVDYEPASMLLVLATDSEMVGIEALMKAWTSSH